MEYNGKNYDFVGWATRSNTKCSDGRVIMENAFKDSCGKSVPLVWNHDHNDPAAVIGHADLVNCRGGVKAFCSFNETENGELCKVLVKHKDIVGLSIYANHLTERGRDVYHGQICEVSLVHKGANPGAYIENVMMHSDDDPEDSATIYFYDSEFLAHSDDYWKDNDEKKEVIEHSEEPKKEEPKVADEAKKPEEGGKTIKDVFDTMNEEQKNVCYAMVGMAMEEANKSGSDDDDEGGDEKMKHNAFDDYDRAPAKAKRGVICHADQEEILSFAKDLNVNSFQKALQVYLDDNELSHADGDVAPASGFVQDPNEDGNISWLFPEYKDVKPGAPELVTSDQGWISTVMNKVHKSPISRIRTRHVDIRNLDDLRAKGYQKGTKKKLTGNFKLARRTTDPQTIYVKNALHKDDITDITDFDYVQYLYNIDRMMLNEELATAIMIGDGRDDGDEDKISPDHIRPIWTDDDIYTIHRDVDIAGARAAIQGTNTTANFGDNYIYAEAIITAMLYAREDYKGSGQPDMFCTPHLLNVMLLARDLNGRRIYDSKNELAAALNVGNIYTVEQFENKTRTEGEGASAVTKKLLALVCNLNDYALGSTKGGEISHFTQFDIDFNQQKSLIETRVSGANTRLYSAIALEETVNPG